MKDRFAPLFLTTLVILILLVVGGSAVRGEDAITLTVKPDKVLYKPGEKAVVNVTLANPGSSDLEGTVVLSEFRDIDTTRKVGSREVLVPAGKSAEASFEYENGEDEYGREIRADFIQDGKTVAKGSEFFSVADNWLRVAMQGNQPLAQELLTYTSPKRAVRVPVTVSVDTRGTFEENETSRQPKALRWDGYDYFKIDKQAVVVGNG